MVWDKQIDPVRQFFRFIPSHSESWYICIYWTLSFLIRCFYSIGLMTIYYFVDNIKVVSQSQISTNRKKFNSRNRKLKWIFSLEKRVRIPVFLKMKFCRKNKFAGESVRTFLKKLPVFFSMINFLFYNIGHLSWLTRGVLA